MATVPQFRPYDLLIARSQQLIEETLAIMEETRDSSERFRESRSQYTEQRMGMRDLLLRDRVDG